MEIVKAQETTQELMQKVVDSKVTRGELLDLIIDRVDSDLRAQINKLDAQRRAAREAQTVSVTGALALVRAGGSPKVEIDQGWGAAERMVRIQVSAYVDPGALPKKYAEAKTLVAALDAQIGELHKQQRRLRDGKKNARVEMIKQSLESTPEGQRILEAIDGLKATVSARLIAAGEVGR